MQAGDVEALAGEHALDLVKAALNELKAGFAGAPDFQLRRQAGLGFAVEPQSSGGEERNEFGTQIGINGDLVDLWNFVARRGPTLDERAVVREEQHPRRVAVEPADTGDRWMTARPAGGQQVINRRPVAPGVRTDAAGGLVEQREQAAGRLNGLAVDEDFGGRRPGVGRAGRRAANHHPARPNPGRPFTAAAIAVTGEDLIQAAGLFENHERNSRTGFQPVSSAILPEEETGAGGPGDRLEACPTNHWFMDRDDNVTA